MSERVCHLLIAGAPLSGRSTCLKWLSEDLGGRAARVPTGDTYVLAANLPTGVLGPSSDFTGLRLETAPGARYTPALYRQMSRDADGVLFVVDSQDVMLESTLAWVGVWFQGTGRDPSQLPFVMVYNKRDLPNAMPVALLEHHLNGRGAPHVQCVAVQGVGLREAFGRLVGLLGGRGRITTSCS